MVFKLEYDNVERVETLDGETFKTLADQKFK